MTLVAFDFDGTLSDSEMTVLLGEQCGAADRMAEITERAMDDEIGYAESLRRRCALLEGLDDADAARAFEAVELRPGAGAVIERLRTAGVAVAILTGGFERGVRAALDRAGVEVDVVVANRLPVDRARSGGAGGDDGSGGVLTGDVEGPLIEGTKDDALEVLTAALGVERGATVAVGDGANDLPMLEAAGFAVGFEPKPAVDPACDAVVGSMEELRTLFEERGLWYTGRRKS